MKKTLLLLAVAACAVSTHASAQMLTISEVYGGGGNSGSTYKNDFIELYNYGTTDIDLSVTPLSVYYASSTGTFSATSLTTSLGSGIIPAGDYFLIQEAAGGAGTTTNPTPNVTGTINLSATAGKVALGTTGTAPSSTAGAVTLGNGLIDFVGFGTANQYLTAVARCCPECRKFHQPGDRDDGSYQQRHRLRRRRTQSANNHSGSCA